MLKKILITFLGLVPLLACEKKMERYEDSFLALNTQCKVVYYSSTKIEGIDKLVYDLEKRVSSYRKESDVYNINRNSGQSFITVHPQTKYILEKALYYSDISNGKFDLTIGPLVSLWNINEKSIVPFERDIENAKKLVDYRRISISEENGFLLNDQGMSIDLGGIAKGFATDLVRDYLRSHGVEKALINLGGNIYAMGLKPDATLWSIGIQDPRGMRGDYVGILNIENSSLVTSGDYERFFMVESKRYHHILDTGTGYPLDGEIISASIISKNSIDGDALSTIAFGMNIHEAVSLMKKTESKGIFITRSKEIHIDKDLEDIFILKDDSYKLFGH